MKERIKKERNVCWREGGREGGKRVVIELYSEKETENVLTIEKLRPGLRVRCNTLEKG